MLTAPLLRALAPLLFLFAAPLTAQFGYVVTSYHGVSDAVHQANVTTLSGQGYRPISLAVSGGLGSPSYSAVWWQSAGPAWVAAHGMTNSQYTAARLNWSLQGFRPKLVTASGSGGNTVWAAIYVQDGVVVSHQTDLTLAAFEADALAKRDSGYRLVSCATYGTSLTPRFAPVYEQVDDVGWGWEADDSAVQFGDNIVDHTDAEHRPAFFGMNDAQRYFSIWHDDRVGGWAWVGNRTSAQFAADKLTMQGQGLYPLSIAAGGSGANARFSGVFVERLVPYARTLTHAGAASVPLAAFDTMMDTFVQQNRIRGATLAVIRDGRLVHARGYNYAEPGYPQTTPTSLFRIGSISKALCGMVAHSLIETGTGGLTLDSNMVSTLGLTSYPPSVGNIELQQLLSHTSGMVNVVDELAAATAAGPLLVMPPDESTIVEYAATFSASLPGFWKYSNAGITAVGQMIEQASGQTYPAALQSRLLTPLGITRFDRQQGPKAQLLAGEVHYHLTDLYLRSGNLYADLRLLAPQYSQRFWDSAGGAVTSAVDLARIIAGSFQIGADSPVFPVSRQDKILHRETYPRYGSSTGQTEGWTDGAWGWDEHAPGEYTYWHDGAQDGFRSMCLFRDDGVGVVVLTNGDHGVSRASLQAAIDATTSWPTGDQFPTFGLPSFPRTPTLGAHLPNTVANVATQPIVFFGEHLDQVTSVLFDTTQLVPALSTAWANGYIDLVNATTLHVYPPQGVTPGVHTVRAFSAAGGGNAVSVPFALASNFTVAAQDYVIGGAMPFSVFVTKGPLSDLSWTALTFSESTLPSVAPGVLTLGIGNQFSNLFNTDLVPFDPVSGLVRWNFPRLGGWSHIDLQALAIDLSAPSLFPLITSNVTTVDRL